MNENYKSKLLASAVTAVLVFSSLLFISGAQATPSDDLEVSQMFEPDGNPPPRANIAYDIVVEWTNDGSSDYDATVRLYATTYQEKCSVELRCQMFVRRHQYHRNHP